ncbi:MAG: beta-galactosidase trimerization domain-containing protein [Armatimonadetes bacterium]|nr:beta-galactosidase trimerization domain-containing protein [Armatimonadota bacterium]
MRDWITKRSRIYWHDQYALNEQETAFTQYDPDRISDELCATGADIVAVYATNQWGVAYYPSRFWPQHPGLAGQDYVGDLTSRLRVRGKRVLLYTNWLDSKHAEWNVIPLGHEEDPYYREQPLASWADPAHPDGRAQKLPGGQWRFPCMNSPARGRIVDIAREIVDRYRPDAFHLDMLLWPWPHICACPYCRPALEAICGTKAVTREAVTARWKEYIDWACERSASLLAEVSAILREKGVVAAHNGQNPVWMPVGYGIDQGWLPSLDVYISEIFSSLVTPGMTMRWHHGLGMPSWMLLTSTLPQYAHWPVSKAQWLLTAAACKANGCHVLGPCGVGARPDTTSAKRLLDHVRFGLDAFMQDADLSEGAVSAAKIALVFSWATRKYHGQGAMRWADEIEGWARLLAEEHLPFDIVTAENIASASSLARYDLLILPDSAYLSDSFCRAVRDYAQSGGKVLATAASSLFDERGDPRIDFALADVLGISHQGALEGDFAYPGAEEAEPASGAFRKVTSSARILRHRIECDPAGSVAGQCDPLPLEAGEWPLWAAHGSAFYIAFDIGRYYKLYGDEHIARFIAEAVALCAPSCPLTVKAPRHIEATLWRQEALRRRVVHLADRTLSAGDMSRINEVTPVCNIEISLPAKNPTVKIRGAEGETLFDGERLTVTVRKMAGYAAVVVEDGQSPYPTE